MTYKYRIKDDSAKRILKQHAFAVNQVWNYCNSVQKDIEARYKAGAQKRRWPSCFDLQKLTTGSSQLLNLHSGTIKWVCRQFAQSRNKAKHSLRFRASNGSRRALGWVPISENYSKIGSNAITFIGKKFCWFGSKNRPLPENTKHAAFVENAQGHWFVCFQVEVGEGHPIGTTKIGIDLGLKSLATCSDGTKIEAPKIYRRHEQKLAKAQRAKNTKRTKALHTKIKNCRKDFLHKTTAKIARENSLIAVGNVSSSKLARTWLAKSVFDAGWAMFRYQLAYKARRHQAVYLCIDERFTTQTCSHCGALPPERPKGIAGLGVREWECSNCGTSHDRDVNAACNILKLALGVERPAEGSRRVDKSIDLFAGRIGTLNSVQIDYVAEIIKESNRG